MTSYICNWLQQCHVAKPLSDTTHWLVVHRAAAGTEKEKISGEGLECELLRILESLRYGKIFNGIKIDELCA